MSIYEYKVVNAECDVCGESLFDKIGVEMTSTREVRTNMKLLGWIEKDGKILCDKCKNK